MERDPVCDRVVLRSVRPAPPVIQGERVPLRRIAGESVEMEAEFLAFGRETLRAVARVRPAGSASWQEVPMTRSAPPAAVGLAGAPVAELWQARLDLPTPGVWQLDLAVWVDDFATWQRRVERQGSEASFEPGARLLLRAAEGAASQGRSGHAKILTGLAKALRESADRDEGVRLALDPELAPLLERFLERRSVTTLEAPIPVVVEEAARATRSWLRLAGDDPLARLETVAALGFEVAVLPGLDLLDSGADATDTAVGSDTAGRELEGAVRARLEAVRAAGLELALELPLSIPPGHPWAAEHPEWVREETYGRRELDLAGDGWRDLCHALDRTIDRWVAAGVATVFVAEPETAPPGFWTWILRGARERHPQLSFWAPAPASPEVAEFLGGAGFVLFERPESPLSTSELRALWNEEGGAAPAARNLALRFAPQALLVESPESRSALAALVLATTGAASYGLLEDEAAPLGAAGKEVSRLLTQLNALRRTRPVYGSEAALKILPTGEPELFCYGSLRGKEFFVVALSLDDSRPRAAWIELPLAALGLKEEAVFHVEDLLTGVRYLWQGRRNSVRIDPSEAPAKVLRLVR